MGSLTALSDVDVVLCQSDVGVSTWTFAHIHIDMDKVIYGQPTWAFGPIHIDMGKWIYGLPTWAFGPIRIDKDKLVYGPQHKPLVQSILTWTIWCMDHNINLWPNLY